MDLKKGLSIGGVFAAGIVIGVLAAEVVVPALGARLESFDVGPFGYVVDPSAEAEDLAGDYLVARLDLEGNTAGWEDVEKWDKDWTFVTTLDDVTEIATGKEEWGLNYTLKIEPGEWVHYTAEYREPVKGDMIVAHLFAPELPDCEDTWVEINALDEKGDSLAMVGSSISFGDWTQLVLDLRHQYGPNDSPLSGTPVFIQIVFALKGVDRPTSETVTVRLVDVAVHHAAGDLTIREQRGSGRGLFDFENWDDGGWQLSNTREPTDTLELQYGEPAYRGVFALRLDASLRAGDPTGVSTVWQGAPPRGGWIAQVYLPEDVPAETILWANLFTYDKTGWVDSEPTNLEKGAWNTLVWDTRDVEWATESEITVGIQIGAEDGPYKGPIYIDDVQVFER